MAEVEEMTERHDPAITWFAVYCNIKCEHRAQMGLREKGFRTFYPTLRKWSRVGKVKKPVDRPLFVRYIFVGLDMERQGFGTVRMTDGVESIVGTAGQPMAIPADFVSEMALAVANGTFDFTVKEKPRPFVPGQRVKIAEGPFQGFVGKVKAVPSAQRVELLIDMLGKIHSVVATPLTLKAA